MILKLGVKIELLFEYRLYKGQNLQSNKQKGKSPIQKKKKKIHKSGTLPKKQKKEVKPTSEKIQNLHKKK